MRPSSLGCLLAFAALPLAAGKWSSIPKEEWNLRDNPALVAQGAVILEHSYDFQPMAYEETLRIRILSQAGLAAAEFHGLPATISFLDGRVVYPDGRVQPITKREDFLKRTVISTVDGTREEGVLIPPGLTSDCVVEVHWFESSLRQQRSMVGQHMGGVSSLPGRFGKICSMDLTTAYPTRMFMIQKSQHVDWSMVFLGSQTYPPRKTDSAKGIAYTFHDLPAYPPAPYALAAARTAPKAILFESTPWLDPAAGKDQAGGFWQNCADLWLKDWYVKFVHKGMDYDAFSKSVREGLSGGPQDRAKEIVRRIFKRIASVDHLFFDEKAPLAASSLMEVDGTSKLSYAAASGYTNDAGLERMVFHVLQDEGLHLKLALVADRRSWLFNPQIRTPYQATHELIGVEDPSGATFWIDPTRRYVPPGEIPFQYQGTSSVIVDAVTWKASVGDIKPTGADADARTFTYEIQASDEAATVKIQAAYKGAPALDARSELATQAPIAREAWFKKALEKDGLSLSQVQVTECLDFTKPLGVQAEGTMAVEAGRLLKIDPFPGMGTRLYLPASLPETRTEPILLTARGLDRAVSLLHVPKGYVLPAPLSWRHQNRWGTVSFRAQQDPATGDVRAEARILADGFFSRSDGYQELKDFLEWVRLAAYPLLTLEKS